MQPHHGIARSQRQRVIRDEKVKVLKAISPLQPTDLVRGQFHGYLDEKGVAPDSNTETYAALRLNIQSWRWAGVPFFIRAGKNLPVTCTEVVARLRRPPATKYMEGELPQNQIRFRISPDMTISMCVSVLSDDGSGGRELEELIATRHPQPDNMEPYERVLTDAMSGDESLFARQDYVEEAWRIVDPVLKASTPVFPYAPQTWGPKEAESITPPGGWSDPVLTPTP